MNAGIDVRIIEYSAANGFAGMSDQLITGNLAIALMINKTSFLRNPNYHLKTDTIDTLDFEKMTAVVNSIYRAAAFLQVKFADKI